MEVSKELLLELFPKALDFRHLTLFEVASSTSRQYESKHYYYEVLARLKEWIKEQGYPLQVTHHLDTVSASTNGYCSPSTSVLTEFEAVALAAEYILECKERQNVPKKD